ncbi:MAG: hypothetical protein M3355_06870 [Actinomycetota bacterium]|nr:hypothetical protein [Actinomycetota bacterium]
MTGSDLSLPEKVLALDAALDGGRIRHAFGGALALAYYAEPRATIDVDVNVFVPPERHADVASALEPLGVCPPIEADARVMRDGQDRWMWDSTPVDLFFSNDPIHDAMEASVRTVPFGDQRIPILSPEHLLLCKVAFDRPKDWLDIEQMALLAGHLDRGEIDEWMDRLIDARDPRRARLEELLGSG